MIEWSPDIQKFIADALSPAKVRSVIVSDEERQATVEVEADQLSLAIGRGGQNVRLAAKLTGYRIDIKTIEGETPAPIERPIDEATPEEEMEDFLDSDGGSSNDEVVSPEEEIAEDAEVIADNTNSEEN